MKPVGMLLLTAIGVIVGLVLLVASAQQTNDLVNTVTLSNSSFTAPAESGSYYFTTYKAISSPVIYNATGDLVPAANYTVTNNVVYNDALAVRVTLGAVNEYANDTWNISGTAQPLGYATDSASRSIVPLIVIFGALAIAVVALAPTLRSGVVDFIKN